MQCCLKMSVPCDMLLHPELLSNEQLLQIIQKRHLRIENLQMKERCDLLDLFHQYCVPYAQRKQRDPGRAKGSSGVRTFNAECKSNLDAANNNLYNKKKPHSNIERLKPPSDALSGQMKRIKIECTTAASIININKRRMSIDEVVSNTPPLKKERKPITWP